MTLDMENNEKLSKEYNKMQINHAKSKHYHNIGYLIYYMQCYCINVFETS